MERAFGQLVRFGMLLWKSREEELDKVILMVLTCVTLHNLCVERFVQSQARHVMTNTNIPSHINVGESVRYDARDEEISNAFLPEDVSLIEHAHISYNKRVIYTDRISMAVA